jgi:hypothetical protein
VLCVNGIHAITVNKTSVRVISTVEETIIQVRGVIRDVRMVKNALRTATMTVPAFIATQIKSAKHVQMILTVMVILARTESVWDNGRCLC